MEAGCHSEEQILALRKGFECASHEKSIFHPFPRYFDTTFLEHLSLISSHHLTNIF
jgi:hypothetical protein